MLRKKGSSPLFPIPSLLPVRRFSLTKYYMDCVTSSGKVILCYASDLEFAPLRLRQSSVLVHTEEGTYARQSFFRGTLPAEGDEGWNWHCPALSVRGRWEGSGPPAPPLTLYEPEAGRNVVWQCLAPRAEVRFFLRGREETGSGYVECLTMTVEPWKLPVDVLHWGRFHGESGEALTWISWEGKHPLSLLLEGGRHVLPAPDLSAAADGSRMAFGSPSSGSCLEFSRATVLRTGDISRTALRYLPGAAKRLLPPSILHLRETKWAGPALFRRGDASLPGFSIHEVVHFHPPCL